MAHVMDGNEMSEEQNCPIWLWARDEAYFYRQPNHNVEFWNLSQTLKKKTNAKIVQKDPL